MLNSFNNTKLFREYVVLKTGNLVLISEFYTAKKRLEKDFKLNVYNSVQNYINVVKKIKEYMPDASVYKKIYGNLYEYYLDTNLHVFCKTCKIIFITTPDQHKNGYGCKNCCKNDYAYEFIPKALQVHGIKYCYEKVNYINNATKVTIICAIHGEFAQVPYSHIRGKGCKPCAIIKQTKTRNQFLQKAKLIHGNKYNYSKVNYINDKSKVIIICTIHGEFTQVPYSHLSGSGCLKCAVINKTKTQEQFIQKAKLIHDNKYNYSKVNYINYKSKVIIICTAHGEFIQKPHSHLSGHGCLKCAVMNKTKTQNQFIQKAKLIHGNKYDYSKVNYINNATKVTIICNIHGEFTQLPHSHLKKCGCTFCKNKTEGILKLFLESKFNVKTQFAFPNSKYRYDFLINKTIIELDGPQHFKQISNWECPKIRKIRDINKTILANKNGYAVIRLLQEDVWNNKYNWQDTLLYYINTQNNVFLYLNSEYDNFINMLNKIYNQI